MKTHISTARPGTPEEKYHLYIDESGDHTYKKLDDVSRRYLCLLGCFFKGDEYVTFHSRLASLKQRHIPHNPDMPVVLHRSDIINCKGPFWRLRDPVRREAFDDALVSLCTQTSFRMVAVVIDKKRLMEGYSSPAHPYHLALGFLLQRYCGYLNHINRVGDVIVESRGTQEDQQLRKSYEFVLSRGIWHTGAQFFQEALTSRKLKLRKKSANIAGLQLADILAHPVKQSILIEQGRLHTPLGPFAQRLLAKVDGKFNRHLYDGRIEGYGKVLYPK